MLTVELIAHMDAGDRRAWTQDQNLRPLSDLGRRQAQLMCDAIATEPVEALFSSPALRCRQTLEPLAQRFGLEITVIENLRETDGFQAPEGWAGRYQPSDMPVGGAYAAGRIARAMIEITGRLKSGRIAICSHGDTAPAFAAFLVGAHDVDLAAPPGRRGSWYTLHLDGDKVTGKLNDLADFPN
jgi:broad specificity phosphatase PhoE